MQTVSAVLDREPATPPDNPKPLTRAPLNVRSSSSLAEEFLSRQDLFLNQAGSTLALYRNPFNNDLVEGAVAADGNCSRLTRGPDGGTWQLEKYPTDPENSDGCTEVVSVIYPGGNPGVVASLPGWLYYYDITADGPKWINGDPISSVNLKVSYTPPLPQRIPVVYGATPDGNLMVTRWEPSSSPRFQAYTQDVKGSLAGGDFVLASLNWADHVLLTVVGGHLTWYTIGLNSQNTGPWTNGGFKVRQILMAYQQDYQNIEAIVLGEDNHLYVACDLQHGGRFARIGNVTASSGTGVRDADSLMHLYLIGDDDSLSVLHQTGWDSTSVPLFTRAKTKGGTEVPVAIPLASRVSAVAVDQYPVDHAVLVTFAAKGVKEGAAEQAPVRLIGQDAATMQWWNESVQLSAPHFYKVSRWQTRVTLLDCDGQPVPLYYVSLHAGSTTTVDVGGETYVLDPQRRTPVRVLTDLRGQVVFTSPASGLVAPAITVSAEGLPVSAEIRPDSGVQSYLAGTGKLPFKPTFDGATLEGAKVNGRPLVPPSVWTPQRTAADAVKGMRSIIAIADPNLPKPQGAGFMLQMYASDRPFFQPFANAEELEAARNHLGTLPEFGGWWDVVADFAGEVWQGIKSGAIAVAGAIVDVAKQAIELAINIGGKIYRLGELAIATLADAFEAVGAAFNMLLVKANELIEWFQRAFSWEHMWNTHKAIDEAFRRIGPVVAGYVGTARTFVDEKFFAGLPGRIDTAFASVGARFDNIIVGELNDRHGEPSFLTRAGQVLAYVNEIRETLVDPIATWFLDKVLGPWIGLLSKALPSVVLPSLEPLREPGQRLLTALEGVFGELEAAFADLFAWMASAMSRTDVDAAESFESASFNGLMAVLRKISLSGVQAVQAIFDALFDLVAAAANLIGTFFGSAIDVGVIGDVWAWFQEQVGILAADRSALTIGGLISLIIAVPTTVFYKLVYGVDAEPFPGGVLPPSDVVPAVAGTQGGDACVLVGMFAAILNNIVLAIADTYVFVKVLGPPITHNENLPLLQDPEVWLGLASIGLAIATNAFSWPSESAVIFSSPDMDTAGEKATFANWIVNWVPPGADLLFALVSTAKRLGGKPGRVMQFVDPLGVYVDAGLAVATLVTGIVESALAEENALQWSANIFLPLGTATLPLRSEYVTQFKPLLPYLLALGISKGAFDSVSVLGATFKWAWMPSKRDQGPAAVAA